MDWWNIIMNDEMFCWLMKYMYVIHVCFSMQALDGLFRENEKQEKLNKLEKRRKKLSELLLKETKEYEVHINIFGW